MERFTISARLKAVARGFKGYEPVIASNDKVQFISPKVYVEYKENVPSGNYMRTKFGKGQLVHSGYKLGTQKPLFTGGAYVGHLTSKMVKEVIRASKYAYKSPQNSNEDYRYQFSFIKISSKKIYASDAYNMIARTEEEFYTGVIEDVQFPVALVPFLKLFKDTGVNIYKKDWIGQIGIEISMPEVSSLKAQFKSDKVDLPKFEWVERNSSDFSVTFNKKELITLLNNSRLEDYTFSRVNLRLKDNQAIFLAEKPEEYGFPYQSYMNILSVEGNVDKPYDVMFSAIFLLNILKDCKGKEVQLSFVRDYGYNLKPIIIEDEFYLMPIKPTY